MPASATDPSGPSLEEILWRAADRFPERPALVDCEEFAEHIARAFDAPIAEEAFAERFFAQADPLHRVPKTLAKAVVRASNRRLHAYEFDLGELDYVIVEEKDELVVVSDSGQFAVEAEGGSVAQALAAATVAAQGATAQPRAVFVRSSGEAIALDARKVARALERATVRPVSLRRVHAAGIRLSPFHPVRKPLTEEAEERALLQDPALAQPLSSGAAFAVGAAARWERTLRRDGRGGRLAILGTGDVVAIVRGQARGGVGDRALAQGEALEAVRTGEAPIALLAARDPGSRLVELTAPLAAAAFWVQPESIFRATLDVGTRAVVVAPAPSASIDGGALVAEAVPELVAPAGSVVRPSPAQALPSPPSAPAAPASAFGADAFRGSAGNVAVLPDAGAAAVAPSATVPSRLASSPPREPSTPALPPARAFCPSLPLPARVGALPATAMRALQLALERSAAFGSWRIPFAPLAAQRPISTARLAATAPSAVSRRAATLPPAGGQVARLVLALPFAEQGALHVGPDLSEALDAYLAAPVKAAPEPISDPAGRRATPPVPSGATAVASTPAPNARPAQETTPALRFAASVTGLPALLQRAVVRTGTWAAGPGAPLALAVREAVVQPVAPAGVGPVAAARPPGAGEEEIVIPLPLWARLGRGAETRVTPWPIRGGARQPPAAGDYRLAGAVAAAVDLPAAVRAELAGADVAGPAIVRVQQRPDGTTTVTPVGGKEATLPVDGRRRVRVGAPIGSEQRTALVAASLAGAPQPAAPAAAASGPVVTRSIAGRAAEPAPGIPAAATVVAGPGPSFASTRSSGEGHALSAWSGHPVSAAPIYPPALADSGPPARAALPVGLRFRYVAAPRWWKPVASDAAALAKAIVLGDATSAADAAASIRRSIAGAAEVFAAGAGDHLPREVAAPPPALRRPPPSGGPAYIAMSSAGAAGAVAAGTAARVRAETVEMSIVAAIPPSPPPLEAMASPGGAAAAEPARARRKQQAAPAGHDEPAEAVSRSKIEGSVDAIAQRIYHRIRRRLQSDRERFGGS